MAKLNITFVDELGSNLNRYKAIDVNTGDEYLFDLSRNGTITTQGTPLNAENMNLIVQAINNIELSYIKSITQDENGKIIITKQDDTTLDLNIANVVEESVQCPHRYEITGNTGDEHGLAINDQQMLLDRVQGRTLVKNQLLDKVNIPQTQTLNGITFTNNGDGTFTINGTATSSFSLTIKNFSTSLNRHKIIIYGCPNGGGADKYRLYIEYRATSIDYVNDFGNGAIKTIPSDTTTCYYQFRIIEGVTVSNLKFTPQLIDLTLKYGAGKEPTTVEQVLNDLNGYEEYDLGSFVHSKNNLISTGRNVWDEEWKLGQIYIESGNETSGNSRIISKNFIPALPNTQYYCSFNDNSNVFYCYDINKNFIGVKYQYNNYFVTLENTYYIKFMLNTTYGTSYKNDICINVFDESFNGKYEPYQEDVMVVDRDLKELEYIDNITNEKVNKGALADLGTLDWQYQETYPRFMAEVENIKNVGSYEFADFLCEKYIASTSHENKTAFHYSTRIYIYDTDYTDVASFKASLQGVMLYYETATETREPLELPRGMAVWGNGMQIQKGTIPYLLTKTYSLSIGAQVKANIAIDKEQQDQINTLNEKHKELREDFDNTFSNQNVKRETSALIDYPSKELSYPNQNVTVDEIRGRSLNVNQLVQPTSWSAYNGSLTNINNSNKETSVTIISDSSTQTYTYGVFQSVNYTLNHKYLFKVDVAEQTITNLAIEFGGTYYDNLNKGTNLITVTISKALNSNYLLIYPRTLPTVDSKFTMKNIEFIDLTQMYGAGNEPTDVNQVLIDIDKFKVDGVLPYNLGELKDVEFSGVKSVGANLLPYPFHYSTFTQNGVTFNDNGDGSLTLNGKATAETGFMLNNTLIIPAGTYTVKIVGATNLNVYGYIAFADRETITFKEARQFTLTENAKVTYFVFVAKSQETFNNNTFKVMLTRGTNEVPYTPYEEDTYEIPQVDLKSAGAVYDSLYPSKGKFVKRIGVVEDMSTLNWTLGDVFYANLPNKKIAESNIVCERYPNANTYFSNMGDKTITGNISYTYIYIKDTSYSDVESLKASLQGVKLYYELATPVETSIVCPNNYKAWQYGTEMQLCNFPTTIVKDYSISILDQITKNVEVDRNQSDNIEKLNEKSNELDIQLKDAINRVVELEGKSFDVNKLTLEAGETIIRLKYDGKTITYISNVSFNYIPDITIEYRIEQEYAERLYIYNGTPYKIYIKSTKGLQAGNYENIVIDVNQTYISEWKRTPGSSPSSYEVEIEYYYYYNETRIGDGSSIHSKKTMELLYTVVNEN